MNAPLPHLSLAEELLLLGLHPQKGSTRLMGKYVEYGVAGAVLAELALAGCVVEERGRVHVRNPVLPPGADPVLVEALERLGPPGKAHRDAVRTSHFVRRSGRTVMGRCLDRLVERGVLRRESKKVWGVFPVVRHPAAGQDFSAVVHQRLADASAAGFPGHRDRLLGAFLYATGLVGRRFPGREGRALRARARDFCHREWTARAVRKAVQSDQASGGGDGGGGE
ncbi:MULTISPECIES: GOLPH3/VPS74 family protein [Streptomyces]|uniref:GPP34 family phosphoprotein n=1 Tax=Streptomyces cremeus TaxID=66881 RepID=A0ABV5PGG4_STRCM